MTFLPQQGTIRKKIHPRSTKKGKTVMFLVKFAKNYSHYYEKVFFHIAFNYNQYSLFVQGSH